jgi:hypothetical protein
VSRPSLLALCVLVSLTACQSASTPQQRPTQGTPPIDLLEQFGIKLPKGKALAKMIADAAGQPLGTKENPVRAAGPQGQRDYLARLRCPDGRAPQFQRTFSAGIGPFGRIIDGYAVTCGAERRELFLDMYHDHVENAPVPGYTIEPASKR